MSATQDTATVAMMAGPMYSVWAASAAWISVHRVVSAHREGSVLDLTPPVSALLEDDADLEVDEIERRGGVKLRL